MLYQILSFLLDVAAGLVTGTCLLRLYMQRQRVSFGNPIGQLVFAFSDWLVRPLRKMVPAVAGWDLACLVGALLAQLAQYLALMLLIGNGFSLLPWLVIFGTVRVAVWGLMALVIIYAVLSWVPTRSPLSGVLAQLTEPLLAPIRRLLPAMGGLDLSPLLLLVLLQVLLIVLGNLQGSVMF